MIGNQRNSLIPLKIISSVTSQHWNVLELACEILFYETVFIFHVISLYLINFNGNKMVLGQYSFICCCCCPFFFKKKKKTSLAFNDSSLKLFSSQTLISSLILRVSFGTTCVRHVTFKRAKCESPGWGTKKICESPFSPLKLMKLRWEDATNSLNHLKIKFATFGCLILQFENLSQHNTFIIPSCVLAFNAK